MASSQVLTGEEEYRPLHHDNEIEVYIPEEGQRLVQAVRDIWQLTSEIRAGPPIFDDCPPLSEAEILEALEILKAARDNAAVSLDNLVRLSTTIQCVLHKTKLKKFICVHSPKIREKFEVLAQTLKKVAKGVFDRIFSDFCAVEPINVEALTHAVTLQDKQVRAIAESARAIQEELACEKLNSVVSENAVAHYRF